MHMIQTIFSYFLVLFLLQSMACQNQVKLAGHTGSFNFFVNCRVLVPVSYWSCVPEISVLIIYFESLNTNVDFVIIL